MYLIFTRDLFTDDGVEQLLKRVMVIKKHSLKARSWPRSARCVAGRLRVFRIAIWSAGRPFDQMDRWIDSCKWWAVALSIPLSEFRTKLKIEFWMFFEVNAAAMATRLAPSAFKKSAAMTASAFCCPTVERFLQCTAKRSIFHTTIHITNAIEEHQVVQNG